MAGSGLRYLPMCTRDGDCDQRGEVAVVFLCEQHTRSDVWERGGVFSAVGKSGLIAD